MESSSRASFSPMDGFFGATGGLVMPSRRSGDEVVTQDGTLILKLPIANGVVLLDLVSSR